MEFIGQRSARNGEVHPGDMHDQINRAAPADVGFVVEPPASCNHDVMSLGFRAERDSLALHVESVMREHVSKRRVANLVSELGNFHDHEALHPLRLALGVDDAAEVLFSDRNR
jgi:hypothetical protein